MRVQGAGGRYTVSARLSSVSGGGNRPTPNAPDGRDFAVSTNTMTVDVDVTVRDAAGRIMFGGVLSKTIEVGSNIKVDGFESSSNTSGEAAYARLQHEVALAVARMVMFHFAPLRVSAITGRTVALNFGSPLLQLGMMAQAIGRDGQPIMLRVITATPGGATAEVYGDGEVAMLAPDGIASVIEADDPAAMHGAIARSTCVISSTAPRPWIRDERCRRSIRSARY